MPQKRNNSSPTIIGLTGGIASGKSTAADILRDMGEVVVCADAIAHDVVKKGKPVLKKIQKEFGNDIIKRGSLDRKAMAEVVFKSPKARKKLEAIIHPYVKKEIKKIITVFKKRKSPRLFIDVPLLFEAGFDKLCHKTLVIAASQKLQIERAKKYRKMTRAQALARIKSQMPMAKKAKKADYVIRNVGTKRELRSQILSYLTQ